MHGTHAYSMACTACSCIALPRGRAAFKQVMCRMPPFLPHSLINVLFHFWPSSTFSGVWKLSMMRPTSRQKNASVKQKATRKP